MRLRKQTQAPPAEEAPAEQPDVLYPWGNFVAAGRLFVKGVPVLSDDPAVRQVIDEIGAGVFYRVEDAP